MGEATILRDKAKDYTERSVGILNVMEKPDMDEILRLIDAIDLKIDDGEAIRELLALPRDRFLQQQVNHVDDVFGRVWCEWCTSLLV